MKAFALLFDELDASTATLDKVAALARHFQQAEPADAAWAVYVLAGGKPLQRVPTAVLRQAACQAAGVDEWLFEECYQAVGDLAETIAHLLPPSGAESPLGLAHWMEARLLPLRGLAPAEQAAHLTQAWAELGPTGRFLLVKLIGGGFRVGVSRQLVLRAVAEASGLPEALLAQRLVGWTGGRAQPSAVRWAALIAPAGQVPAESGQPYPFFLAHALDVPPQELGPIDDWLLEWKYDGIRAQVVKRAGQVRIWSRGEELVSERFPEVLVLAARLPDGTVLDGELLAWRSGEAQPAPFKLLQQRLNRKALGKKLLAEAPVVFLAYDLLEQGGADLREQAQALRRAQLEALLATGPFALSPLLQPASWAEAAASRQQARARGVEGLMLKSRQARYGVGRTKAEGLWWKWKVEPFSVDAVLIYAQAGHGRRASMYTDYTFAVWNRPPASAEEAQAVVEAIARREPAEPGALQLLPFAKAYSGLSDAEIRDVDRVVRATTLEKFGPVRSLRPTLVFEIGFEGIGASPRHKSGVAVRFPRILRPRPDKPLHEADALAVLEAHLLLIG